MTAKIPEKGPNGGRPEGYEPLKQAVAQSQARKCDPAVYAWVAQTWARSGAVWREIVLNHVRFAGSDGSTAMTLTDLARYFEGDTGARADDGGRKIALELDEEMNRYAANYAGIVRFVLVAVSDAGGVISKLPVSKKGGSREGDDDAGIEVSERGTVALLLKHVREQDAQTLRHTTMVFDRLERHAERCEASTEKFHAAMPTIAESFAKLLDALEKTADMSVERQIKLRKELRKDRVHEKGVEVLMRFAPRLIQEVTKGTRFESTGREIAAAPELERLFVSLMKDKERLGRIFAELKEEEQSSLLLLLESFPDPTEKEIEAKQKEAAPAAPTPEGSG